MSGIAQEIRAREIARAGADRAELAGRPRHEWRQLLYPEEAAELESIADEWAPLAGIQFDFCAPYLERTGAEDGD